MAAAAGGVSVDQCRALESGSSLCCRAGVALLGFFHLLWFIHWLVIVHLYGSVVGKCEEIPLDTHAYMACGALYCANRIADLLTGLVLLIGVYMRKPMFLQAFVLYEVFTFVGWIIIFALQWSFGRDGEEEMVEEGQKEGISRLLEWLLFTSKRLFQLLAMYVVLRLKSELVLEREQERKQVRFYI